MSTYSEKLRDPRWQKKRLEIMQRDGFKCQNCNANDITLNVHHACYLKGREPWEYDDDILITLCEECHKRIETQKIELLKICVFPSVMDAVLIFARVSQTELWEWVIMISQIIAMIERENEFYELSYGEIENCFKYHLCRLIDLINEFGPIDSKLTPCLTNYYVNVDALRNKIRSIEYDVSKLCDAIGFAGYAGGSEGISDAIKLVNHQADIIKNLEEQIKELEARGD